MEEISCVTKIFTFKYPLYRVTNLSVYYKYNTECHHVDANTKHKRLVNRCFSKLAIPETNTFKQFNRFAIKINTAQPQWSSRKP